MKKALLVLAVSLMFGVMAIAQDSGQTGSSQAPSTKSHKMGSKGKMSTLTGCLSKDANSEGMYTLSNGRYKKGVEVGPTDKVKDHAGHQVKLSGHWASAAAAGETGAAASSTKEKGEHHFEVDSVTHISDTCSEAPGGGTTGTASKGAHKSKKGMGSSSTPQNPQ